LAEVAAPDEGRGKNLDIVLPEEGPGDFAAAALETEAEELGDVGGQAEELLQAPVVDVASDVAGTKAFAAYEDEESVAPESLLDDGAEAATPLETGAASPAMRSSGGLEDLDVLPDLEGFSDSFAAPGYGASDTASEGSAALPPGRAASGRQTDTAGLDPAALAQAVRTILKRDTKG